MNWVPDARHQYLCLELATVSVLDCYEVPDHAHPVLADVVQAPNERAQIRGSRLHGGETLIRREDERHVDWYPHLAECLRGLQPLRYHWDFDDYVLGERFVALPLRDHPFIVGRNDLSAHRVGIDLLANCLYRLFKVGSFLDNQRGVRCDSVY